MTAPTHDQISDRARALWEAAGRPDGQDTAFWLQAEQDLRSSNAEPERAANSAARRKAAAPAKRQ